MEGYINVLNNQGGIELAIPFTYNLANMLLQASAANWDYVRMMTCAMSL